jgi:DNA-directed RNA polymerase subunit H (RpoH/RPB5)
MIRDDLMKCHHTLCEMLEDRGIQGAQNALRQPSVLEQLEQNVLSHAVLDFPVNDELKVIFFLLPKVKIGDLKRAMASNQHTHCIMIFKEKPTVASLKALAGHKHVRLELFDMRELSFNVSRHALVPKHVPIKDEAFVSKLMDAYKIKTKNQLPLILRTDPMARYLGLQAGDVVEITRPSPTAGVYKHYRCCV